MGCDKWGNWECETHVELRGGHRLECAHLENEVGRLLWREVGVPRAPLSRMCDPLSHNLCDEQQEIGVLRSIDEQDEREQQQLAYVARLGHALGGELYRELE